MKAARAAQRQVQAATEAELPIILVQRYVIRRIPDADEPEGELPPMEVVQVDTTPVEELLAAPCELQCAIVNHGRTPAEFVSYCLETRITSKLPPEPEYNGVYEFSPGTMLIRGNSPPRCPSLNSKELSVDKQAAWPRAG